MTLNHKLIWNEVRDYMFIALGLAIYTVAFTVFLMPYQIVAGGVTGLSAIIYYATGFHLENTVASAIPVSTQPMIIDMKS